MTAFRFLGYTPVPWSRTHLFPTAKCLLIIITAGISRGFSGIRMPMGTCSTAALHLWVLLQLWLISSLPPPAAFQAHTCRTARTLTGAASSRRLQAENPVVTVSVPVPKSIISILVDTFKRGHFSSLPNERINRVLDQQKSVGRGKERAGRSRIVHPSCRGEQNPSLVRRNDLLPLPRLSEGRRGMRSSLFVLYCLGHLHKKRLFVI